MALARPLLVACLLQAAAAAFDARPFLTTTLLAVRTVDDGSAPPGTALRVALDELHPNGTLRQSVELPSAAVEVPGQARACTLPAARSDDWAAAVDGGPSLTGDGRLLLLPCWDVPAGSLVTPAANRTIAVVGANGVADTGGGFITSAAASGGWATAPLAVASAAGGAVYLGGALGLALLPGRSVVDALTPLLACGATADGGGGGALCDGAPLRSLQWRAGALHAVLQLNGSAAGGLGRDTLGGVARVALPPGGGSAGSPANLTALPGALGALPGLTAFAAGETASTIYAAVAFPNGPGAAPASALVRYELSAASGLWGAASAPAGVHPTGVVRGLWGRTEAGSGARAFTLYAALDIGSVVRVDASRMGAASPEDPYAAAGVIADPPPDWLPGAGAAPPLRGVAPPPAAALSPTPTMTPWAFSPTRTASPSASVSGSASATRSGTPTPSRSGSRSGTPTPTPTGTATATPPSSPTPTPTGSPTPTASATPSRTPTGSRTPSRSRSATPSATPSPVPPASPLACGSLVTVVVGGGGGGSGGGATAPGAALPVWAEERSPTTGAVLRRVGLGCTLGVGSFGWLLDSDGLPSLAADGASVVLPCFASPPGGALSMGDAKLVATLGADFTVRLSAPVGGAYVGTFGPSGVRQAAVWGGGADGVYLSGMAAQGWGFQRVNATTGEAAGVLGASEGEPGYVDPRGVAVSGGRLYGAASAEDAVGGVFLIAGEEPRAGGAGAGTAPTAVPLAAADAGGMLVPWSFVFQTRGDADGPADALWLAVDTQGAGGSLAATPALLARYVLGAPPAGGPACGDGGAGCWRLDLTVPLDDAQPAYSVAGRWEAAASGGARRGANEYVLYAASPSRVHVYHPASGEGPAVLVNLAAEYPLGALAGGLVGLRGVAVAPRAAGACAVPSASLTASGTPSPTRTATGTPSGTASGTPTPSWSPSGTGTPTPSSTGTPTASGSRTASPTGTPTRTATPTPTWTPSPTSTPSGTPTQTGSPTGSPTGAPSGTPTPSGTGSPTPSGTASMTATATGSLSATATPTALSTGTPSGSGSGSPTASSTAPPTGSASSSGTPTASASPSASVSPTPSGTRTRLRTTTPTATASVPASPSASASGTASPSATLTGGATSSITASPTASVSSSGTPSPSLPPVLVLPVDAAVGGLSLTALGDPEVVVTLRTGLQCAAGLVGDGAGVSLLRACDAADPTRCLAVSAELNAVERACPAGFDAAAPASVAPGTARLRRERRAQADVGVAGVVATFAFAIPAPSACGGAAEPLAAATVAALGGPNGAAALADALGAAGFFTAAAAADPTLDLSAFRVNLTVVLPPPSAAPTPGGAGGCGDPTPSNAAAASGLPSRTATASPASASVAPTGSPTAAAAASRTPAAAGVAAAAAAPRAPVEAGVAIIVALSLVASCAVILTCSCIAGCRRKHGVR